MNTPRQAVRRETTLRSQRCNTLLASFHIPSKRPPYETGRPKRRDLGAARTARLSATSGITMEAQQPDASITLILVAATATSALAMSVFLPALPEMASFYGVSYSRVQLSLSVYLGTTAIINLLAGPASDRWGRRPVMLVCFAIFLTGTLASVFAPNFEILLLSRVLQAFSAVGLTLSRAIARDIAGPEGATVLIGYITMGMAVIPMIGPTIGGLLVEAFGWKSAFVFNFAFGAVSFILLCKFLPETGRGADAATQLIRADYLRLFGSPYFWGYCGAIAFTTSMYLAFLGGSSLVASVFFGQRPLVFALYLGAMSGGYILGNYLSGLFVGRIGMTAVLLLGGFSCVVPVVLAIWLFAIGIIHPLALYVPLAAMGVGNGLVLPIASTGAVSVEPRLAGAASGLCGSLQIAGGCIATFVAGILVQPHGNPIPLLLLICGCGIGALLSAAFVAWLDQSRAR